MFISLTVFKAVCYLKLPIINNININNGVNSRYFRNCYKASHEQAVKRFFECKNRLKSSKTSKHVKKHPIAI